MIRLSSIVARIEDRVAGAYAAAKPAVAAKAGAVRDEYIIRTQAAKYARTVYTQIITDVKAARK